MWVAVVVVVALVVGGLVAVAVVVSGRGDGPPVAAPSSTTVTTSASRSSTTRSTPRSTTTRSTTRTTTAPSPTTSATTSATGAPAGPAETADLTALGRQLIDLLNAGDEAGLAGIACGTFSGDVAAEGSIDPQTDPIIFSRVSDLLVDGDTASGQIFAGTAGEAPTGADATFGRTAGRWQICSLG